jgi:hypothetical protein
VSSFILKRQRKIFFWWFCLWNLQNYYFRGFLFISGEFSKPTSSSKSHYFEVVPSSLSLLPLFLFWVFLLLVLLVLLFVHRSFLAFSCSFRLLSFPASWLSSPLTAETLVCWFMFDIDLHPLLPRGHEITWDVMVGL